MANPSNYATTSIFQKKWIFITIDNFINDFKQMSGKCMDMGCGPGDITNDVLLPRLHPNAVIIGTDISKTMIEYANKTYANNRIRFEMMDMETKNLPEKYISEFDHLFSFHAVHWCKDIQQAINNMHRMLRPGGTLFIMMIASYDSLNDCIKMIEQNTTASYMQYGKEYISPLHSPTSNEEMTKLLEDSGFTVHSCNIHEQKLNRQDIENIQSSVYSLILNKMPHDVADEFKKDFKRFYEEARLKHHGNDPLHCSEQTFIDSHALFIIYAQKNSS